MEEKKEKKTLLEKLSNIQSELKAPKNQRNTFGNYNYRSAEDILEAVKPLLKENKLSLVLSDEIIVLGEHNPQSYIEKIWDKEAKQFKEEVRFTGQQRYYIKATATLYDIESEAIISNSAFAREEETKKGMDGSQITGTASSYARKYALNGLFNIDDTKDADTDEFKNQEKKGNEEEYNKEKPAKKTPTTSKVTSLATAKQIERLKSLVPSEEIPAMLEFYKIEKLEDLTVTQASATIKKRSGN